MRQWTTVLVAVLAGCGGGQAPSAPQASSGISTNFVCPDRNCTHNNGTGIYYAENGFAGIGDSQLMITHFLNTGTGVMVQGRYLDQASKTWRWLPRPGVITGAEYPGLHEPIVRAVHEAGTVPRWTLQGKLQRTVVDRQSAPITTPAPQGPVKPSTEQASGKLVRRTGVLLNPPPAPVKEVTGDQLRDLKLYVSVTFGDHLRFYLLDFAGPPENLVADRPALEQRQPAKYSMRWRNQYNPSPGPTPYCKGPRDLPDHAVFQEGITVDPLNGAVQTNPAAVTLSCSLGAPAKVYAWGYDYDPAKTEAFSLFRAGIHMKRASYCGDSEFYTVTGTPLLVGDSLGINRDLPTSRVTAGGLEAWWTPEGATCVNSGAVRQPSIVRQKGFQGVCGTRKLPACELPPPPDGATVRYLISAPVRQ